MKEYKVKFFVSTDNIIHADIKTETGLIVETANSIEEL